MEGCHSELPFPIASHLVRRQAQLAHHSQLPTHEACLSRHLVASQGKKIVDREFLGLVMKLALSVQTVLMAFTKAARSMNLMINLLKNSIFLFVDECYFSS